MPQKTSREAPISIGDRKFRLCFSIIAIVSLTDHWKLEDDSACLARLDEIGQSFQKGRINFRTICDVIWAGLQEFHAGEITPAELLKLLSQAGMDRAPELMTVAFQQLIAASPPQEGRQAGPTEAMPVE